MARRAREPREGGAFGLLHVAMLQPDAGVVLNPCRSVKHNPELKCGLDVTDADYAALAAKAGNG